MDARIHAIAADELDRAVVEWHPAAAVVVVLDAATGAIVTLEGRDGARSDPAVASQRAYVTGSTLKTFTIAAALEAGTVDPSSRFDCARRRYAEGELGDSSPNGSLSLGEVLSLSSNVGASRVGDTVGLPRLVATLRRAHVGDPPGDIPPVRDAAGLDAGLLAAGEWVRATPLQVAAAYAAVFDGGAYHAPASRLPLGAPEQVLSVPTAATLAAMLEYAVSSAEGHGRNARVEGLRVAGKTGTADLGGGRMYASFVGTVIDHAPRLVVRVGLEAPQGDATGPTAAAPVFARIVHRVW